jgi:hypothetical protein
MVSVMSSPHYDNNDDGSAHESNNQVKAESSSNLRRRHNTGIATNGEYRLGSPEMKQDGEADVHVTEREGLHPLPKSLTPFVQIQSSDAVDTELDAYNSHSHATSPEPNTQEVDEEAQFHQNRAISYDRENSFHASFLTTDSISNADFNNSGRSARSNNCGQREFSRSRDRENDVDHQKGMPLKDPPSIGDENAISFRRENASYEMENNDERSIRSGTGSGGSSSEEIRPKNRSLFAMFQRSRRIVGKLVNNASVQATIILLIILNSILMGVATTKMVTENEDTEQIVERLDNAFLVIFTIEIGMQLYYFGFALFFDSWLVFDLIVVLISWFANEYKVVRAFRIFRAFRLVTRVRPLRDLVLALGDVLPRMSAIVLLLVVVFYVFAVLFTEQFADVPMEENFFSTLHDSFLSCFQMMTMEWSEICRELMEEHGRKHAWITIVAFVMLAGFIVFNLIVAVVVEAVSATEETVRRLDGIESNSPGSQLAEAQERVDLLQSHLNEMMEQQEQIQFMLETMAGELLHLETERMKAKYREVRLREEINRRIESEKKIEEDNSDGALTSMSMQFLKRIEAQKAQRKQEEENQSEAFQGSSERDSVTDQSTKKKKAKRITLSCSSIKPGIARDGSGRSLGSNQSANSNRSGLDVFDSPIQKSAKSARKTLDLAPSRSTSLKGKSEKEEPKGSEPTERKVKAMKNWKNLLAVNKEFEL